MLRGFGSNSAFLKNEATQVTGELGTLLTAANQVAQKQRTLVFLGIAALAGAIMARVMRQ